MKNNTRLRCAKQTCLVLLLEALAWPAWAQQPTAAECALMLKATIAASQAVLKQYEWVETTLISFKGEAESRKQDRGYYGADGGVQKIELSKSPEPKKERGLRGRIAAYNPTTGQGAAGRYASGAYGSAGAMRTTEGGGMAAWNTQNGQGAVGKTQSGDIYAAKDGTVYKKDSNGSWSQDSGSGWQNTGNAQSSSYSGSSSPSRQSQAGSYSQSRGTPQNTSSASSSWSRTQPSMESQAQARQHGNQQTQKTQSWQNSRGSSRGASWGGSRSSSGGGRRR